MEYFIKQKGIITWKPGSLITLSKDLIKHDQGLHRISHINVINHWPDDILSCVIDQCRL